MTIILALLGIAVIVYMLVDFEDFIYRSVIPNFWDKFFGIILILLVLEATRRTTGWIMPGNSHRIYCLCIHWTPASQLPGHTGDMILIALWAICI